MFLARKEIMQLIVGSIVIYLLFVASLYIFQRNFIYYPDPNRPDRTVYKASDMDVVSFRTEDGLELQAWYKAPAGDKPVIVVFHGNASHMGGSAWKVRPYLDAGYGALLPAYRGYAGNPGQPTEQGLYVDARATMDWLISEKAIKENRIVLLGESLGSGVAVEMAANHYTDVKAVVLESPYTSFVDMAKRTYFFVPFLNYLVKDQYRSIEKIGSVKAPLLIVHGKLDIVVPYEMGQRLFHAANELKEMATLDLAGHNDLYIKGASQRILHFLPSL